MARAAGAVRHPVRGLAVTGLAAVALAGATDGAYAAQKYAAFILDANTGKTLHSAHADAQRYPASLTKMMTLYVVFEMIKKKRLTLDSELVITKRAASQQPSKLGVKAGTRVAMRDAIRALITKSANDVAVAVAENLAGTEAKFARYMTWRARQLGLRHTTFRNASGLTAPGQKTTARDMATLGLRLAEDHPKLFRFFRTRYFKYGKKSYKNHNKLLFNFAGTEGIKTGYTRASGFNLVTSVRKGKRHVIGVVMGGKSGRRRDAKMRSLLRAHVKRASTRRTRTKVPVPQLVAQANPKQKNKTVKPRRIAELTKAPANRAAFKVPSPQPAKRSSAAKADGPYHVQVGAHADEKSANRHLHQVLRKAGSIVGNHAPVTMAFDRNDRRWYRARFAGFSRSAARSACQNLKQRKIDCIVMAAQ
ncbi:MAG: serine hydrolase [Hyphomicrobiaceae bacterium]